VLTVDPGLQAYRTDKLSGVERSCPQPGGDITCDQVGYATFVAMKPASASAGGGSSDDGSNGLLIVVIVVGAAIVIGAVVMIVRRRRAGREAVEIER
jgi:hypothetical protein